MWLLPGGPSSPPSWVSHFPLAFLLIFIFLLRPHDSKVKKWLIFFFLLLFPPPALLFLVFAYFFVHFSPSWVVTSYSFTIMYFIVQTWGAFIVTGCLYTFSLVEEETCILINLQQDSQRCSVQKKLYHRSKTHTNQDVHKTSTEYGCEVGRFTKHWVSEIPGILLLLFYNSAWSHHMGSACVLQKFVNYSQIHFLVAAIKRSLSNFMVAQDFKGAGPCQDRSL